MNQDRSNQDLDESIGRYLDGDLDADGFSELKEALRGNAAVRDRYLEAVRMDALLREIAGRRELFLAEPETPARRRISWPKLGAAAAVAASLAGLMTVKFFIFKSDGVAEIRGLSEVEWLSEVRKSGDDLDPGEVLELAAGSVDLQFRSGASTRLIGPARFEITSANGGYLHHGEAASRADTPGSHGFAIRTQSGHFIDQGTEFLTTARIDGFSQMHVTSGAVDVEVPGFARQRFEKGNGLGIEPGDRPLVIRIESGEETGAFRFPTIPPPSDADWADRRQARSSVELISVDRKGRLNLAHRSSGAPEQLFDGRAQSGPNLPGESFFFANGTVGMILLDLGAEIPVSRIHTYSWHLRGINENRDKALRAVQRYTLWGAAGSRPANPPSEEDPGGWSRIARVDTDAFFEVAEARDRPAQQACAIESSAPSFGRFRYLLFEVKPTRMPGESHERHTYFGEIDVFTPEDQ